MTDSLPHRATLADVAEALGVSKATVSKALNGRDGISPETRERVLATVAALDYRPTTSPSPSASRRAIAAVFDIPGSPYILGVLQGALAAATAGHLDLLTRLAPEGSSRRRRAVARNWIADQRAAGVVGIVGLTLSEPDGLIAAASEVGMPFVIVDPVDTHSRNLVSIGSSNWAGARNATEHLLTLGHRRIAWVGGPAASDAARERLYGYRAALDAAGIPVDPLLTRTGRFDTTSGSEHARELLALGQPPTAIMAGDDEIAVGVLATAHAMGIRVPEDLSVTGFDDTPQSAWTTPPLTTVHQHLEGMGEVAVQTILAMGDGGRPASRRIELATTLTIRSSTGPAPTARTRA
ncbi:LacI family DNA-binding transcriptional regulator [Microbacterium azadirachtae]|uniref:HTH-type transcriptional regulator DegA n=1 Tax=Microbacterium azadirachtae TaxID=582680 RepID=A0A0F0KDG6_9MICO|nr:LacI family DNA-binding transcriptional regulator [Microbacterium azadirachtae]KJL18903.1 HTH-type transcriptional regulator DegA [Microbacterium azadirachtae]UXW87551.1 LacI family DNA-binding transcriptional regulator [Microbacterium azadirachtae]